MGNLKCESTVLYPFNSEFCHLELSAAVVFPTKVCELIQMAWYISIVAFAMFSTLVTRGACLKNVQLYLKPPIVERGYEMTAKCEYDLEGEPLFSLKWYRGNYEFYRYSPSESPPMKIFNFTWINVDIKKSNETQVTIRDVGFHLDGNFSCEVTTDAPNFSTASSWRALSVISPPASKPLITTENYEYELGEVLRANCSASASKPAVKLTLMLNNITVGESGRNMKESNVIQQHNGNPKFEGQAVRVNLLLQSSHFIRGQLILRCIAEIPTAYSAISELHLRSKIKDPIPEKVTSDSTNIKSSIHILSVGTLIILAFLYTYR